MESSPIQKRKRQRLIGFVVLVVVLIVVGGIYRGYVWNALSYIQSPLTRAASWVQDAAFVDAFSGKRISS